MTDVELAKAIVGHSLEQAMKALTEHTHHTREAERAFVESLALGCAAFAVAAGYTEAEFLTLARESYAGGREIDHEAEVEIAAEKARNAITNRSEKS